MSAETTKQALTRRNATNSLYQYFGACIHVAVKHLGWQILITKSKRSSKRMLAYFPIKKILSRDGKTVIFDDGINYLVEEGKLKFDENGCLVEESKDKNKECRTSVKMRNNQLVLLHLFNETFKRKKIVDPEVRVECTKSTSDNDKLTSKRLSSLPFFDYNSNKLVCERRDLVEQKIGAKVHQSLCSLFQSSNRLTPILIGLKECSDKHSSLNDIQFYPFEKIENDLTKYDSPTAIPKSPKCDEPKVPENKEPIIFVPFTHFDFSQPQQSNNV